MLFVHPYIWTMILYHYLLLKSKSKLAYIFVILVPFISSLFKSHFNKKFTKIQFLAEKEAKSYLQKHHSQLNIHKKYLKISLLKNSIKSYQNKSGCTRDDISCIPILKLYKVPNLDHKSPHTRFRPQNFCKTSTCLCQAPSTHKNYIGDRKFPTPKCNFLASDYCPEVYCDLKTSSLVSNRCLERNRDLYFPRWRRFRTEFLLRIAYSKKQGRFWQCIGMKSIPLNVFLRWFPVIKHWID